MPPYFQDLMDRYSGSQLREDGNLYVLRVVGRGEHLFFQENSRCLLCEADAVHGVISRKSIRQWDSSGEKLNSAEKARIAALILAFYQRIYNPDAVLR